MAEALKKFEAEADHFKTIGRKVRERKDEGRWNRGDDQERMEILRQYLRARHSGCTQKRVESKREYDLDS